jgi:hypothetical protein
MRRAIRCGYAVDILIALLTLRIVTAVWTAPWAQMCAVLLIIYCCGMPLAARHLLSLGLRRIALVGLYLPVPFFFVVGFTGHGLVFVDPALHASPAVVLLPPSPAPSNAQSR